MPHSTANISRKLTRFVSTICLRLGVFAILMVSAPTGVVSAETAGNGDYSAGLSAYIDGDFSLAQSMWLKAARQDHNRAMFNLGLLHQQEKISNADAAKARRWFRLAGEGGYAAADFHHANWLLEQGGDQREIRGYLERAAYNGYLPASQKINSSLLLASDTDGKTVDTTPGSLQLDYLDQHWLKRRNAFAWTIQVLAFNELEKVKQFIDRHSLHDRAAYFPQRTGDGLLYKLVYGEFADKEAAEKARVELNSALQEHGPWLRTLASVQAVIDQQ